MSLPRYAEYKDSGIEWLGEVPTHWSVVPLRNLGTVINGYPFSSDLFDSEDGFPLVRIRDLNKENTEILYRGEFLPSASVTSEDILIGMDGDFSVGRWKGNGVALLNQRLCCVRGMTNIISRYLEYVLPLPMNIINEITYSTTVKHLSSSQVEKTPVAISADEAEQLAIITFLDRETAKIDALIAEQERLIALLAEKRQAVISHAVTKGLNPAAPMKDSGIEWLGEVPAHWVILSLGRVTIDKCDGPFGSGLKSEHYVDDGVRVIRLQNIRAGEFYGVDCAYIDEDYFKISLSGHGVVSGDVLIAGLGDDRNIVGRSCVAPIDIEPAMVKADCFRFRLNNGRALSDFVSIQLTAGSPADAGTMSSGSTRSRIPLSIMATRKLALPSLSEQAEIVAFLQAETAKLDTLTTEAHRAIDLLKEHRSALISAAVTGKIDVRGLVLAAA